MIRNGVRRAMIATMVVACVIVILLVHANMTVGPAISVGFVYDTEEAVAYSHNFYRAQEALRKEYGDRVKVFMYSNVQDDKVQEPLRALVDRGCKIIFTNSYGNVRKIAKEHPEIEFCQVSSTTYPVGEALPNYHTFKGEAYQVRYASGVVAGVKLRQMIDQGSIEPSEALVGFVAAYPYAEVISGYTAFLLGVRSVVPHATMRVKYTNSWNSYTLEKACASELMDEGCAVISQHTDTIGPAVACEEYYARDVFHVGYHEDMTDVAPHVSLTSARIDWTPYVKGAVEAIMTGRKIEDVVGGNVHANNDVSGGIRDGWVALTTLNEGLLPEEAQARVDEVMRGLRAGRIDVFHGDYTGRNPADANDVMDLSVGYKENAESSVPTFCYVLDGVVAVEE